MLEVRRANCLPWWNGGLVRGCGPARRHKRVVVGTGTDARRHAAVTRGASAGGDSNQKGKVQNVQRTGTACPWRRVPLLRRVQRRVRPQPHEVDRGGSRPKQRGVCPVIRHASPVRDHINTGDVDRVGVVV